MSNSAYLASDLERHYLKRLNELKSLLAEREATIKAWEQAAQKGHPSPCNLGPLCPYCEIERLRYDITRRKENAIDACDRLTAAEARVLELTEAGAALYDAALDTLACNVVAAHLDSAAEGWMRAMEKS